VFSDDLAADIRAEYRELLEDQVPDLEATQRVVNAYRELDADEASVFWVALAAAQFQVGRLDDSVRARAMEIIDTGRNLELWQEADPGLLAKRRSALTKLRAKLTGPQPARKAIRRPWRHVSGLQPGDVLSFKASSGRIALLRVTRINDHRVGAAPIVEWLDWPGLTVPTPGQIEQLQPRAGGGRHPDTHNVAKYRKKDPDWCDLGFEIAARVRPRPQDETSKAWSYLDWKNLANSLTRVLASE
jgi:hypothetical protein